MKWILAVLVTLMMVGCGEEATEPQVPGLDQSELYGWYSSYPVYYGIGSNEIILWTNSDGGTRPYVCTYVASWKFVSSTTSTITIKLWNDWNGEQTAVFTVDESRDYGPGLSWSIEGWDYYNSPPCFKETCEADTLYSRYIGELPESPTCW